MNKKQKKKQHYYWFILDNYVHVSVKGSSALFYNPLTGKILEYNDTNPEGAVFRLIKRLQSFKNLPVIRLGNKDLSNTEISQFVRAMRAHFMGDLVDASLSGGKPVQMKPYVKIQKDAEKMKRQEHRSVGDKMMNYLAEISLYINDTCSLACDICNSAYKQFLCCTCSGGGKKELDLLSIKGLFEQLQGAQLVRVNLLGGDVFDYANLEELFAVLKGQARSFEIVLYSHYLNLFNREKELMKIAANSVCLKVPVTFPVNMERWKHINETLKSYNNNVHFVFIISSEEEFALAEELVSRFPSENYSLSPFFNGSNRAFFEKNIFLDKEDIPETRPTLKDIMSRQLVNPLHFGTLTALSNGHIHANVNEPRLGILGRNSMYDAVYKEMYRGKSWRRIRKKVKPCKHCTFEALCPPLSNYEYALGRNNLCHISR